MSRIWEILQLLRQRYADSHFPWFLLLLLVVVVFVLIFPPPPFFFFSGRLCCSESVFSDTTPSRIICSLMRSECVEIR